MAQYQYDGLIAIIRTGAWLVVLFVCALLFLVMLILVPARADIISTNGLTVIAPPSVTVR